MASAESTSPATSDDEVIANSSSNSFSAIPALKLLSSLKLTVVLFALSIFIVFAGTLAQTYMDIWEVVDEYFRIDFFVLFPGTAPYINPEELFVFIKLKTFLPVSFFPRADELEIYRSGRGFYFPKGWTIGFVMLANLFAAHMVRFKVQAKGARLFCGLMMILIGTAVGVLVVASSSSGTGIQDQAIMSYGTFRFILLGTLISLSGATLFSSLALFQDQPEKRKIYGIGAVLLALTAYFVVQWDVNNNDGSMRILYQISKATLVACLLHIGCLLAFKKRAGIVLMHVGVAMIMLFDVVVGTMHEETRVILVEKQTTNFSRDIREIEFAIIDSSDEHNDHVFTISEDRLLQGSTNENNGALRTNGAEISDKRLPFNVQIVEYHKNADLRELASLGPNEEAPKVVATSGIGEGVIVIPMDKSTGTDNNATPDMPTAYYKITSKSGEDLGTFLGSTMFEISNSGVPETESVTVDGITYGLALRFKRQYFDYTITLKDIQKNDYMGTTNARDYSSYIKVANLDGTGEFEQHIWMNHPMRFAGKTFYQSGYSIDADKVETTTLQTVDNWGWMSTYVACMMVVVGLIYQFSISLETFLRRRMTAFSSFDAKVFSTQDKFGSIFSAVIVSLLLGGFLYYGLKPRDKTGEFQITKFGELPMWSNGRAMPIRTYALNSLISISDRGTCRDQEDEKIRAEEWLLQIMADVDKAQELRTFRIENTELIEALSLKRRKRLTYSASELREKVDKLTEIAVEANKVEKKSRTIFQRKTLELATRVQKMHFVQFSLTDAPELPALEIKDGSKEERLLQSGQRLNIYANILAGLDQEHKIAFEDRPLPLMVPTHLGEAQRLPAELFETEWEPFIRAQIFAQVYRDFDADAPPAISLFANIVKAYRDNDPKEFNKRLSEYRHFLEENKDVDNSLLPLAHVDNESLYNRFDALNLSSWMYLVGLVFALIGWLCFPQIFQRGAFWSTVGVFLIHTAALGARYWISGRPPVTNLYTSSVFIGWAVVLGSLIIEKMSNLGFGNVVASLAGFATLRIAAALAASDGDTFGVLEAVLDTQFWLATHVVCITLGYSATYLAGLIGALFILGGIFSPAVDEKASKEMYRMTYGVICCAIFFSFFGTVLGGLWADDSWGRFWGWDPKENGALIIVLWNALVLHARWGKIVGDRGTAILAVLGNIVVTWSWFGVNELGVGLHTYGFTEGRLMWILYFSSSQIALSALALIPRRYWMSSIAKANSGSLGEADT